MKNRVKLAAKLDQFYVFLHTERFRINKSRYARKRLKSIGGGYHGSSSEFNTTVVPFWKKYGVHPKRYWYDLYCNHMDHYDPRFIPDALWFGKILPYYNSILLLRAYTDKGMLDRFLPFVKQPETVIKNVAGHFYTGDNRLITREEAVALCLKEDRLIFKPSLYSGGGRHIQFYEKNEMDESTVSRYFDEYDLGYIAQRIVRQHPDLARIHPQSLNSIRVITFHFQGEIHLLSAQLRMGSGDAKVDNVSSGGCACAIKEDGWLFDRSVNRKSEWFYEHPSGLKFSEIRVPNYDKVRETAVRLHQAMPYFDIIGWDFSVCEDGEPLLVEFNVMPDQNQIGCGMPTFGDLTEAVLEDVFVTKKLANRYE